MGGCLGFGWRLCIQIEHGRRHCGVSCWNRCVCHQKAVALYDCEGIEFTIRLNAFLGAKIYKIILILHAFKEQAGGYPYIINTVICGNWFVVVCPVHAMVSWCFVQKIQFTKTQDMQFP